MSLTNVKRLALFEKRPWKITGSRDGKSYTGFQYKGFDKDNGVVVFNCEQDLFPVYDLGGYEESHARDFRLLGVEFGGKVKWKFVPEMQA